MARIKNQAKTEERLAEEPKFFRCQYSMTCPYPARLKVNETWVCVVCYDKALRPETV